MTLQWRLLPAETSRVWRETNGCGGMVQNKRLQPLKTRNIGARTKVMGRRNFQESIIVSINKTCLKHINWTMGKTVEFRGDPLFKTARKYINKRNGKI